MRTVHLRSADPALQAQFDAWKSGPAAAASTAVCGAADGKRKALMKAHEDVYQRLRDYLLWRFYNKCAYCETDHRSSRVQVEHFRPRAKVTGQKSHPGYYWLMFDPENLLPSCSLCNNKKRNKFPIRGKRASGPGDNLKAEEPELLDPYDENENIESHIAFVTDGSDEKLFGTVKAVNDSRKGALSIECYGLNEDAKVRARQSEMKAFLREFKDAYDDAAKREQLWTSLYEGSRPFSAACEARVNAWLDELERERKKRGGRRKPGP